MCHLYPYNNVKLPRKFFYINFCGFIGSGKFLYETRVLDNSCLQFKFKLPTSEKDKGIGIIVILYSRYMTVDR